MIRIGRVADRVRDLREKLLVRRSVAAADRVGLVVEVLRLQVGMQRHLVLTSQADVKDPGLAVVDPDDCVKMGWHGCPLTAGMGSFPRGPLASKSAAWVPRRIRGKRLALPRIGQLTQVNRPQPAGNIGSGGVSPSFPACRGRARTGRRDPRRGIRSRHFREQIDVAGSDGTSAEAHVGRCQIQRLKQHADARDQPAIACKYSDFVDLRRRRAASDAVLTATDMGLGGCAVGTSNIDSVRENDGDRIPRRGSVGQFALGRGRPETTG